MPRTAIACVAALLLAGGCSETANYCEFAGAVTADGKPVEEGLIMFTPTAAGPGQAPVAADISGGSYRVTPAKKMTPGSYKVAITAERDTGRTISSEPDSRDATPMREQYIPPRYNASTELTSDIAADQSTPVDFNLTLKKSK